MVNGYTLTLFNPDKGTWSYKASATLGTLKEGENTLNLKLCTLLIDSLNHCEGYDADDYLERYITFMTTPGNHNDTYVEEYHRHFFTNYARGKSPRKCGVNEKHIGGLVGAVPIVTFYRDDPKRARDAALEHLSLTHLGEKMEASASLIIELLLQALVIDPIVDSADRAEEMMEHMLRLQAGYLPQME